MNEKQRKVLTLSLLAYVIGGFLLAIGIQLHTTLTIITFYCIGICMLAAGILCLYNNYKLERTTKLYLFLMMIGIGLAIFMTIVTISEL